MTNKKGNEMKINWSGRGHDYTEEDIAAVVDVMRNGDPQTQGKHLKEFEDNFSQTYADGRFCFGMTNCAHTLEMSAILSGIGDEDEVIIPGHTYCASAIPFARTGAKLRWADIEPSTFLVSKKTIEPLITDRTKVIVVVHLYGMIVPDIQAIADLASSRGILLVEDCAQSLGAMLNGRYAGTFGDFGCFSFHAQKNITTLGEGGMLVVKSPDMARMIPGLRHNGHAPFAGQSDYWKPAMSNVTSDMDGIWPFNYSLGEAQSALGSSLLKRVPELTKQRRSRAAQFRKALSIFDELKFQAIGQPEGHSHHLLVAKYESPKPNITNDNLIRMLSSEYGIKAIVQYYPLYRYDLFKKNGLGNAECPETDKFFDNMISFPAHVWMSEDDFKYLIESTVTALTRLRQ